MRISLINNHPENTGFGNYAFDIYEELSNKCQIDHIYLNHSQKKIEKIEGRSRKSIAKLSRFFINQRYFFYYKAQKKIPLYDLYLIANQNLSFLKVKPKIVVCHDLVHQVCPRNLLYRGISKFLFSGLKEAEIVIAVSKSTKEDLKKIYSIPEDKIIVIYEGVNHKKFKLGEKSLEIYKKFHLSHSYKYLLHISSETPNKNVEGLIKAFYKVKEKYKISNLKLLKAGVPQYRRDRKKILKLVRKLGLEEDIIFLGYISSEDLAKLYRMATLFAFPSYYEGFGLPVLEAMACGTPVITSNTSSLPEVVGDAGIMVNPRDIDGLTEAIYQVLINEKTRKEMIKKGLDRAKVFSWEKTAQETLKVCQKVYEQR